MVDSKIGDVPGLLALFLEVTERLGKNSPAITAFTEVMRQRMPNMFGIGRADEQLFETIRQLLDAGKRHFIDLVVGEMRDYEETIFRLTVTGMSCGNEVVPGTPVKNTVKGGPDIETKKSVSWEFTTKDLRVKYLDGIADEVAQLAASSTEKLAAKQVVKAMRSRRLITRSPSAQKAYELWIKTTKWVEKDILQLFGPDMNKLSDITPDQIAELINRFAGLSPEPSAEQNPSFLSRKFRDLNLWVRHKLGLQIPERKKVNLNPGWWRWMFQNHLLYTLAVIAVIVVAIAASLTPPPIH